MKPTAETFEQWNEVHALKHDLDKFYNHPNRLFRYIENKRVSTLIKFADIKEDNLVLEVGCGAGNILERIPKGILYGVDISSIQIERAKKRLGDKATIIKCPGESLPFDDKYFDRILCTEVFEHVFDPLPVLMELHRTLKDNGIVSLSVPNERLINFTKRSLSAAGMKRILKPKESGWDLSLKNNLEEWHLHSYSLGLIKKQIRNIFRIQIIAEIPNTLVPFRYVLKLAKK